MNRLIHEQSPYLLQHAKQPVFWFPWGDEAFNKAKLEDKPILLSIGYATCHWCHVMAHESFDDIDIAKILNEYFICIKLDREERPDLDHIYMTAVSAMTGSGGWPLNVFLTSERKPFFGGTYFPPVAKWGAPGFKELITSIHAAWVHNREELISSADTLTHSIALHMSSKPCEDTLDESLLHQAYQRIERDCDSVHGGFGSMPKFPMSQVLWFLMRYHHLSQKQKALDMVDHTLTSMANGGIWDHLAGGFHRYSVDASWHVPHFEKMLYDQAVLLRAYTEGYQSTGKEKYAQVAREIANFVLKEMTGEHGGFYCALDADSLNDSGHQAEGAYYVFSHKEIECTLDGQSAKVFNAAYDVKPEGNVGEDPHGEFIGKNIFKRVMTDEELAQQFNLSISDVIHIIKQSKEKLSAVRQQRARPFLDDKVCADLNGLMIDALSFAANVLDEPAYALASKKSADFIWDQLWVNGRLKHRWRNGESAFAGTLDDYIRLADGLIACYQTNFEEIYLDRAKLLMDTVCKFFKDPHGGFFMVAEDQTDILVRPKDLGDGAIACANSMAAIVSIRLLALTGEEVYQDILNGLFRFYAKNIQQRPSSFAGLWCAWMQEHHGGAEILFHGNMKNKEIAKIRKILYKDFRAFTVVRATAGETDCVYVCRRRVCHSPVTTAEDFIKVISEK